jgi:hypothetical protein
MTNLTDHLGIAIVYINMIILFLVILLAVRLYMKYCRYIDVKRKYVQKRTRIYK